MAILLIGLNHQTAPVEIREQMALSVCVQEGAFEELLVNIQNSQNLENTEMNLREAVILSTCNRLEIYAISDSPESGFAVIKNFLSHSLGISFDQIGSYFYLKEDLEAVEHLFRVSAGLDSMILGEPQILGQVSSAYSTAQNSGTTGPLISHLFSQAIHAGKRVRTETEISRHTTSVSHSAALLAQKTLGDLSLKTMLIIGAGEMAEQTATAFRSHGIRNILFTNRTFTHAKALADNLEGEAFNWYHLPQTLVTADIVISATGAPHTIIYTDDVEKILAERNGRELLFIDIAVPRDIERAVGELPGVILYDIDDLQNSLDENINQREAAVPFAERILQNEVEIFLKWQSGREVVPVINDLRQFANGIAQAEAEWAAHKLTSSEAKDVIDQLAHRIVNKILHNPTLVLKARASVGDGNEYAHTIRELFALKNSIVDINETKKV